MQNNTLSTARAALTSLLVGVAVGALLIALGYTYATNRLGADKAHRQVTHSDLQIMQDLAQARMCLPGDVE